jgi:hypothetical protein
VPADEPFRAARERPDAGWRNFRRDGRAGKARPPIRRRAASAARVCRWRLVPSRPRITVHRAAVGRAVVAHRHRHAVRAEQADLPRARAVETGRADLLEVALAAELVLDAIAAGAVQHRPLRLVQYRQYQQASDRTAAAQVRAELAEAYAQVGITSCAGTPCVQLDKDAPRWGGKGGYVLIQRYPNEKPR